MNERYTTHHGRTYVRLSNWTNIRTLYDITPRHRLWDYATDGSGWRPGQTLFDPTYGTYCSVFRFRGQDIPTERFYGIGSMAVSGGPIPYTTKDGKTAFITAVDLDGNLYDPLYL